MEPRGVSLASREHTAPALLRETTNERGERDDADDAETSKSRWKKVATLDLAFPGNLAGGDSALVATETRSWMRPGDQPRRAARRRARLTCIEEPEENLARRGDARELASAHRGRATKEHHHTGRRTIESVPVSGSRRARAPRNSRVCIT